jgi:hypothetical protein
MIINFAFLFIYIYIYILGHSLFRFWLGFSLAMFLLSSFESYLRLLHILMVEYSIKFIYVLIDDLWN